MTDRTRQLAAIMFTDIVGYSKIMGSNESKALELLRKNRKLQKEIITKHNGYWIKEMGDGTVAKFNTAIDAVNCAIEIQSTANDTLDEKLRIGIHLGDITIENDDVFGDGVNIASRIESTAEPGEVYVTEAVVLAIKGVGKYSDQYVGEKKLKNIDRPIKVYKILEEVPVRKGYPRLSYFRITAILILLIVAVVWVITKEDSSAKRKSIVVLPLNLVDSDSTKEALVQGITEELIRSMGKIDAVTVLGTTTTNVLKASLDPISDAYNKLPKTDYFLGGSLEINEPMIILDLELYDREESVVWSMLYKEDMVGIPNLTVKIGNDIATAIKAKVPERRLDRLSELKPIDPKLYELWIKGLNQINIRNPASFAAARVYLNEAVEQHPADARAWAMLAEGLVSMGHSTMPPEGVWREAKSAAIRALQLDSLNAEAWAALAHIKTYFEWDYEGAELAYSKANELNPNNAWNHYHYAWHLYLHDRLDEAIAEHTKAKELDPLRPGHTAWLGLLYIEIGDYEKARIEAYKALAIRKNFPISYFILGNIHYEKQEYDSAIYYFQKGFGIAMVAVSNLKKGENDKAFEILGNIKSRPLNSMNAFNLAIIYSEIDSADQFFKYANYEPPLYAVPWYRHIIKNEKIIKDPRYKVLMNKMNLPMPKGYN